MKFSETEMKSSETEVKFSETEMKSSETEVKFSETEMKSSETEVKFSETEMKSSKTEVKKSGTQKDVEAIRQAVLDYVEGAYMVDPSRTKRSVHPELAKLGFVREESGYTEHRMTFEELVEIVKTFNQDGHIPEDAPKNITIYEVLDQTASVKLEAWWGIDYIHLAKFDGKWMIINVLWQTHPPK